MIFRKLIEQTIIFICIISLTNFMWLSPSKPKWLGTSPEVGFFINPNFTGSQAGTDEQQIAAILRAADTWFNEGGANFRFRYAGMTTNEEVQAPNNVMPPPPCGELRALPRTVFAYQMPDPDIPSNTLATTYSWRCGGDLVHFDMAFNDRDFDWNHDLTLGGGGEDIRAVATHELGHALGLSHCRSGQTVDECQEMRPGVYTGGGTNPGGLLGLGDPPQIATMSKFSSGVDDRTLSSDDIEGVQTLYDKRSYPINATGEGIQGVGSLEVTDAAGEMFNVFEFDTLNDTIDTLRSGTYTLTSSVSPPQDCTFSLNGTQVNSFEVENSMINRTCSTAYTANGCDPNIFEPAVSLSINCTYRYFHSCAGYSGGGGVECWGDNSRKQLRQSSLTGGATSTHVPQDSASGDVIALSAGDFHTCAIIKNGSNADVDCWGDNSRHQIGRSRTDFFGGTPIFSSNITSIAVSDSH